MPQLNLLREPRPLILAQSVGMPLGGAGRWVFGVSVTDCDGRSLAHGDWAIKHSAEHADIGLVMKEVYDHWFNADPLTTPEATDRALRRWLR